MFIWDFTDQISLERMNLSLNYNIIGQKFSSGKSVFDIQPAEIQQNMGCPPDSTGMFLQLFTFDSQFIFFAILTGIIFLKRKKKDNNH